MTKLHQLHDRYGQSPWLTTTRGDATGDHLVWYRSGTDVFFGQHD
jgi:hypothetical protein